jgi:hypothetical protein
MGGASAGGRMMIRVPDTSPPFDTQSAVEHLQAGGLSSAQAVAITRTLVDATANLVTKADLAAVESRLQAGIDDLKGTIDDLKGTVDDLKGSDRESRASIGGLREAIGEVRAEIARSQAATVRMMLFMSFGIIGAVAGLLRILPQ